MEALEERESGTTWMMDQWTMPERLHGHRLQLFLLPDTAETTLNSGVPKIHPHFENGNQIQIACSKA